MNTQRMNKDKIWKESNRQLLSDPDIHDIFE